MGRVTIPIKPGMEVLDVPRRRVGIAKMVLDGDAALVEFRRPNRPSVCARCGSSGNLSVNGATGEITCMRSGCGHDHGFTTYTARVPKVDLVPQTDFLEKQERARWERRRIVAEEELKRVLDLGRRRGWTA